MVKKEATAPDLEGWSIQFISDEEGWSFSHEDGTYGKVQSEDDIYPAIAHLNANLAGTELVV